MKQLFVLTLISSLCFYSYNLFGQTRAVTEDGDTIYVYDDGTWSYELREEEEGIYEGLFDEVKFDTSKTQFSTPRSADKTIASKLDFFEINYNSKKWKRIPSRQVNPDAEIVLQHRSKDIFSAVISEETEIGLEMVYKAAILNAEQGIGSKPTIIKKEVRTLNGVKIIHSIFQVDFNGLNMVFMGNYYSTEKGTVQAIVWTANNVFEKNKAEMENLINGFEVK